MENSKDFQRWHAIDSLMWGLKITYTVCIETVGCADDAFQKMQIGFNYPSVFNKHLDLSDQVKYQGVILDGNLSWKTHH